MHTSYLSTLGIIDILEKNIAAYISAFIELSANLCGIMSHICHQYHQSHRWIKMTNMGYVASCLMFVTNITNHIGGEKLQIWGMWHHTSYLSPIILVDKNDKYGAFGIMPHICHQYHQSYWLRKMTNRWYVASFLIYVTNHIG